VTATHNYSEAKRIFCGVDVSSEFLDVQVGRDGAKAQYSNDEEGIKELAAFCRTNAVDVVAMEASGGYEQLPFRLLHAVGIEVAIVNARAVRRFAQAMHLFEKTDRIDAGVIAWYAETKRVNASQPPSVDLQRLKALVTRLRQLTELRQAQQNQRRLVRERAVLAGFHKLLVLVNKQIKALEQEIAALLSADPLWQELDKSFRTIKGVANRTVARLMAELPEIGTLSNKKISKLVGLAPLADDSGKHKGKRRIYGGRQNVRNILYIVVTCVSRHNSDFSDFRDRLLQAGKAKKVARVALAHKLLIRLNAKAREVRHLLASQEGSFPTG
jgi:transposase